VASLYSWDIFCRVIDNFGDIGVCWRLAADLAGRGHRVRLWADDPSALAWMAPGAREGHWPGVQVLHWTEAMAPADLAGHGPADVWLEGFGCEPDAAHLARCQEAWAAGTNTPPVWINLEYLSAEPFATRAHRLPSPIAQGPARGQARWFFYPGLTSATGGLLREPDLGARLARFDRGAWLARQGIAWSGERLVSLFCYEPAALPDMLLKLEHAARPTHLLVAQGRGAQAVRSHLGRGLDQPTDAAQTGWSRGALTVSFLPALSQTEYDHLLWTGDLNYVRGEDSFVRALWAGKPFVWQIYPQHDGAHQAKLLAMLDALQAPMSWRDYHLAWNGLTPGPLPEPDPEAWAAAAGLARSALLTQCDLCERLCEFVERVRQTRSSATKQS
jgi:uncharacterized repeat protein (TIGR03837 family)